MTSTHRYTTALHHMQGALYVPVTEPSRPFGHVVPDVVPPLNPDVINAARRYVTRKCADANTILATLGINPTIRRNQ